MLPLFTFWICRQLTFRLISYLHHFLPILLLNGQLTKQYLKSLIMNNERVKYHQLPMVILKLPHIDQQESVMYLKDTV